MKKNHQIAQKKFEKERKANSNRWAEFEQRLNDFKVSIPPLLPR
jgi:hypothetical protein